MLFSRGERILFAASNGQTHLATMITPGEKISRIELDDTLPNSSLRESERSVTKPGAWACKILYVHNSNLRLLSRNDDGAVPSTFASMYYGLHHEDRRVLERCFDNGTTL